MDATLFWWNSRLPFFILVRITYHKVEDYSRNKTIKSICMQLIMPVFMFLNISVLYFVVPKQKILEFILFTRLWQSHVWQSVWYTRDFFSQFFYIEVVVLMHSHQPLKSVHLITKKPSQSSCYTAPWLEINSNWIITLSVILRLDCTLSLIDAVFYQGTISLSRFWPNPTSDMNDITLVRKPLRGVT